MLPDVCCGSLPAAAALRRSAFSSASLAARTSSCVGTFLELLSAPYVTKAAASRTRTQ